MYASDEAEYTIYVYDFVQNTHVKVGAIDNECTGDGYGYPPEDALLQAERNYNPNNIPWLEIYWTANGILFAGQDCGGMALLNEQGRLVWTLKEDIYLGLPVMSPDGKSALVDYLLLDVSTGNLTQDSELIRRGLWPALAWITDKRVIVQLVGDESKTETVDGDPVGDFVFGGWIFACDYRIKLVEMNLDGSQPGRIRYTRRGYAVGALRVTPDGTAAVFSFITSSYERAKAVNDGESVQTVLKILGADVELVAISLTPAPTKVLWTVRGGQPAIGKGDFVAVAR